MELWKKGLWINEQEHLNDKQSSIIAYIGILTISITLCLWLYLNPPGTSINTIQFWWNYLIQALKYHRKSSCLINDFGLSEGYIFSKGHDRGIQQSMAPKSGYIKGLVLLIKCQSHTLIHDRMQWKCCNLANLEILETV